MALFGSFDFGKALKKQAEAYSRAPSGSRARKLPQLLKQLDDFASKFLGTVISHSSQVNPGQLRAGAETLVEISALLQDPTAAYRVFAELASRSRKVPAVPQLGQLVDKLLEQPTDRRRERAALLTYRIVTGTLSSERFIDYLRERAHLTEQSSDWKEYALGIARLIRDGVVQTDDDLVSGTLQDLADNKHHLGEQAVSIQQMLAESMIQRRNYRQAEMILVDAAVSGGELPDQIFETVEALLSSRPETCWELHQLAISRGLALLEQGELDWPSLLQKLAGAREHEPELLSYLIELPITQDEPRLNLYVRQNLPNLARKERDELTERFDQLAASQGTAVPPAKTAPLPPDLGKSAGREQRPLAYLETAAHGNVDSVSLRKLLGENVQAASLDLGTSRSLLRQLADSGMPEWAPLEARLWLVEVLTSQGKDRLAVQLLEDLLQLSNPRETQLVVERLGPEGLRALCQRLHVALNGRNPAEHWLSLMRLSLVAEDFRHAQEILAEIPAAEPQKRQAFAELEHWITRQAQPTPWMLITLSEARRDCSDDPTAGFDVATQAALLAPNDANVQAAYQQWSAHMPVEAVHERRLSQAMYLLTREDRLELLPVIFSEIQQAQANGVSTLDWLDQLAPVVDRLRGTSRSSARLTILKLLAAVDLTAFQERFAQLTGELETEDLASLLAELQQEPGLASEFIETQRAELAERLAGMARSRVSKELKVAKVSGRPLRYSAGEIQPETTAPAPSSSPWRRALGLARRKRVAGDADGAIRELQAALQLDPQEPELALELAEAFVDKGEYRVARQIFGETSERLGQKGNVELRLRALYGLAMVIEHLEHPAEAVHLLEELLTIRHDYRDTHERLAALKQSLTIESAAASTTPSNIAANMILEGILELLYSRSAELAEVAD